MRRNGWIGGNTQSLFDQFRNRVFVDDGKLRSGFRHQRRPFQKDSLS